MINKNENLLLISIKPKYAKKIFDEGKVIELRKSLPQRVSENDVMLIYVTFPIMEVLGICTIEKFITDSPKEFWQKHGNLTGISKEEFYNYYKDNSKAFGIQIKNIKKIVNSSLTLEKLRNIIPGFQPPQTYRYLDNKINKHLVLKKNEDLPF